MSEKVKAVLWTEGSASHVVKLEAGDYARGFESGFAEGGGAYGAGSVACLYVGGEVFGDLLDGDPKAEEEETQDILEALEVTLEEALAAYQVEEEANAQRLPKESPSLPRTFPELTEDKVKFLLLVSRRGSDGAHPYIFTGGHQTMAVRLEAEGLIFRQNLRYYATVFGKKIADYLQLLNDEELPMPWEGESND